MLVSIVGTARGTLRLLDKFGALSVQLTVGPRAEACRGRHAAR